VELASSGCFDTLERLERMIVDTETSFFMMGFTPRRGVSWAREDIGGGSVPNCSESLFDSQGLGVGERLGASAATSSNFSPIRFIL